MADELISVGGSGSKKKLRDMADGSWAEIVAPAANTSAVLLASAVQAATISTPDQANLSARGVEIIFDITAVPTIVTVTLTVEAKDPASGKYYTLLAGAAEVAIATRVYRLYPGLTAVANATVSDVLPSKWRVTVTPSGAGNFTYSVGAHLLA